MKTLFFFSAILTQVQNNLLDVRYSLSRVKLCFQSKYTYITLILCCFVMYYLQNIAKMTRWYTAYDFCIATCFSYLMALYWSHDYSMCACCFNLQVNLRLILVSGKTKEFLFYPNDSVADVTDFVYRNWPRGNIKPFFPRCNLFKRRCAKLWKMCHVTETPPFPPLN